MKITSKKKKKAQLKKNNSKDRVRKINKHPNSHSNNKKKFCLYKNQFKATSNKQALLY